MKYIIYQGANEQFRWRKVDDEGVMLEMSDLLPSREAAVEAVKQLDKKAEVEIRPTIAEVAEGEQ